MEDNHRTSLSSPGINTNPRAEWERLLLGHPLRSEDLPNELRELLSKLNRKLAARHPPPCG
jgi:hypothetical protein